MQYDLIVIGGGPAGYVGAIKAAQAGRKVVCVERERVGGTCLNWGCIPTKALLRNAEVYDTIAGHAAEFGLRVEGLSVDWAEVIGRSRRISERLSGGISFLFKKYKVDSLEGDASIPAPGIVRAVHADGTEETIEGSRILICTGARTREIPAFPMNGKTIIGSKDALTLQRLPKSMIVIGSGAIGSEFTSIYSTFGTEVTLIEAMPRILPNEDDESSQALERAFRKRGVKCLAGAAVKSVRDRGGSVIAEVADKSGKILEIEAELCLSAVGVQPVVPQAAELELTERGFIRVDERYRTSIPGVYAAGDCIGGVLLAHTASYEAVQAVSGMFDPAFTPGKAEFFPSCTYTHPQVASVGRTERSLKEEGVSYRAGKFPFQASGRAVAAGETEGFVKLLYGKEDGELLGAHIVGAQATELIAVPGLGISSELTDEDFLRTIFAHPTLSEALHEATLASSGNPVHA